jgi:hypothetical protein
MDHDGAGRWQGVDLQNWESTQLSVEARWSGRVTIGHNDLLVDLCIPKVIIQCLGFILDKGSSGLNGLKGSVGIGLGRLVSTGDKVIDNHNTIIPQSYRFVSKVKTWHGIKPIVHFLSVLIKLKRNTRTKFNKISIKLMQPK